MTRLLVGAFALLTAISLLATAGGWGIGNVPVQKETISVREGSVGRGIHGGYRRGK